MKLHKLHLGGFMLLQSILEPLWSCIVVAMMSSCISITITQQEIFRPLRDWVKSKSNKLGHLISCFYCFSHWIVFIAILIYRPIIIHSGISAVDLVSTIFFTVYLATIFSGLIFKVMRTAIAKAVEENEVKAKLGL